MLPTIDVLQIQHLISFVTALLGDLVQDLGSAIGDFGTTVSAQAANPNVMAMLTTGIFGTDSGLIYWINEKVFWVIEHLPWCELGHGVGTLLRGLTSPPPC